MKWKILLWAVVLVFEAALITVILSNDFVKRQQDIEFSAVESMLGSSKALELNQEASSIYKKLFVDSGFIKGFYRLYLTPKEKREKSRGIEELGSSVIPWVEDRFKVFLRVLYGAIYRFLYLLYILPFAIPVILAGLIDGLVKRQIKKTGMGYANPTYYHFSKHILFITIFTPVVFAFLPFGANPYIFMTWFLALPFVIWIGVSNVQHFAEN